MSPDDPWEQRGSLRSRLTDALRTSRPVRGRRVRRTLRHVEPWSVLKLSLLFYAAVFLIVFVAFALLWTAARASGVTDNVEDFITEVAVVGDCVPIAGFEPEEEPTTTSSSVPDEVDQLDPSRGTTSVPQQEAQGDESEDDRGDDLFDDGDDCRTGTELVGGFQFVDWQVFLALAFGGLIMILAATGATVVLALLFNLMSDLTGGVDLTTIDEEPRRRRPPDQGSPPPRRRD